MKKKYIIITDNSQNNIVTDIFVTPISCNHNNNVYSIITLYSLQRSEVNTF